ncbi:hypothetical protein Trydic_g17756 [Trypoxylus dichotomus]
MRTQPGWYGEAAASRQRQEPANKRHTSDLLPKPEDILDEENVNDKHDTMFELLQRLANYENSDIWNLVTMGTKEEDKNTNDETAEIHKISHDEGRQVLEKAL